MASKSELESENASLKLRIQELEGSLSGGPRAPSAEDATSAALLVEIEKQRQVILAKDARIAELETELAVSAELRQIAMAETAAASLQQRQPDGERLTAKEISRGLLYREIDESAPFVRV